MKVYIKNKILTLGGSSEVLDEQKQPIYKVQGKVLSPTKKKFVYDMQGNLLYIVRNRWFNVFVNKTYIFDSEKVKIATIVKNKFSLSRNYKIKDCVDNIEIQGKFFGRTSDILRNGEEIGLITREFTMINDAFTLEANQEDIPFLTALVVALDNIVDKRKREDQ